MTLQEQFPPIPSADSTDNNNFADVIGNKNDTVLSNSLYATTRKQGGEIVTKTLTCDGNGAQTDNIFQITGTVRVIELYGVCTEATDSTTLSATSFTLYDGTNTEDVTESSTGTDLSGIGVDGFVAKTATAGTALTFHDNSQVRITGSANRVFTPFATTQKASTNTYIRFNFTGDANTDTDIKFYVRYAPISEDGAIAAV